MWARDWLQSGVAQNANLWGANLEGADLGECDLRVANLWIANLRNARLWTDLRGAMLHNADLCGAQLSSLLGNARFDETTTLPDGTNG
ncbi:MAG: pentapeptide repeat-containing protein [Chloroflexota bacterium]